MSTYLPGEEMRTLGECVVVALGARTAFRYFQPTTRLEMTGPMSDDGTRFMPVTRRAGESNWQEHLLVTSAQKRWPMLDAPR